jgi:hypothetical protein
MPQPLLKQCLQTYTNFWLWFGVVVEVGGLLHHQAAVAVAVDFLWE